MVNVPYNPVPTVRPSEQATPFEHINTPEAAFGENIARSVQGLGGQFEKAADMLSSNAIARQQLMNETQAKEADANYMIAVGQEHANYSALEGKAQVDAYPAYQQKLKDLRQQFRQNLPNDMARKMYDSSSLSTMSRTLFNGAGQAASAQKRYMNDTSQSRVKALTDLNGSAPEDEAGATARRAAIKDEVQSQGEVMGWSETTTKLRQNEANSHALEQQIKALAVNKPHAAQALLEKHRDELLGDDLLRANQIVKLNMDRVGARNIQQSVSEGWAPYMTPDQIAHAHGVQPALTNVIKRAQEILGIDFPVTVGDGGGANRTKDMKGNLVAGRAVDLVPLRNGAPDYSVSREELGKINAAMQQAGKELGVPIESAKDRSISHYSLPKEYDQAVIPPLKPKSVEQQVKAAKAYAEKLAPEDGQFHYATEQAVRTGHATQKAIEADNLNTNKQTVWSGLNGDLTKGKPPTSLDQLFNANDKVREAFSALPSTTQHSVLQQLEHNAKGDPVRLTPERLQRYFELRGMDPATFAGVDLLKEDLPLPEKKELFNRQKSKEVESVHLNASLGNVHQMLQDAGITRDPKLYDTFKGRFEFELEQYHDQNKKNMPFQEQRELVSRLLQANKSSGWFVHPYQFELTPEAISATTAAIKKVKGEDYEPTEQEVQGAYNAAVAANRAKARGQPSSE